MTGGSALYLLMCLVTFGAFSWVLAHVSSRQDREEHAPSPQPAGDPAKVT